MTVCGSRVRTGQWLVVAATAVVAGLLFTETLSAQAYVPPQYGADFPVIGSRAAVWIVAQVHLMFAAFVLGVPMFAVIAEAIALFGGEDRYDRLAKEFTRLLLVAYSATALLGGLFVFLLTTLYPALWTYLSEVFRISMWMYAGIFFAESATLYMYYYGWDRWKEGRAKLGHWGLGLLLNVWGTVALLIANSWLTFMMSPPGDLTPDTSPASVQFWSAFANATWMPINIHRLIANAVFGGSIVAAYAAYRFLKAKSDEERAHYDWMGYVGNMIAIGVFLVLPFAGYYLGREIYEFNQQMGVTMMGGFMSWLWIIQAFLIGVLFLAGNYYLWIGLGRIPGGERFAPYTKWMLLVLVVGVIVWATPHTMIADRAELAAMGGTFHPFLEPLGVMSAKNTAVNLMILTTFLSFLLYRRANQNPTVSWARTGTITQGILLVVCSLVVLFYGIAGYFVPAIVRIGFSVYQVLAVLFTIIGVFTLDTLIARGAESRGEIRWGRMPPRSQYALFILVVTFTWLMGLMGFARSGIRQHWHVYEVMQDTSAYAATPALGYAAQIISASVVIFFLMIAFVFWIGGMIAKPALVPAGNEVGEAALAPVVGGPERSEGGADRSAGIEPGLSRSPERDREESRRMGAVDLKVGGVVFGTILVFTLVANAIPQVQSDVPELIAFGAEVTAEELVGAGQGLFEGAGGCVACHAEGTGARGPNLVTDYQGEGTIGQRCGDRIAGLDCKEYLYHALTLPADDLVDDFPPIMPALDRTMNQQQVWAVVAYLQSLGGEVTVTGADIQTEAGTGDAGGAVASAGAVGVAGNDPVEIIDQECALCHLVAGGGIELGPPLDGIGGRLSADEIRVSILDPGASVAEGYEELLGAMPPTFGDRFTAAQLESVVSYLSGLE